MSSLKFDINACN